MKLFLVTAFVLIAGCSKKPVCTETETNIGGAGAKFDFRSCRDGKDRDVTCELAGTQWSCTCAVAGVRGKTFQLPSKGQMVSNKLVTIEAAEDKCGW